jgi:small-conductance mechanosensitive channel
MEQFIMGAIAMASAVVALFFLRFWRETGDRLFAMFALAFLLLGITRFGLAVSRDVAATPAAAVQKADEGDSAEPGSTVEVEEAQTHWYWVRFAAFVLIVIAIVDKNRR